MLPCLLTCVFVRSCVCLFASLLICLFVSLFVSGVCLLMCSFAQVLLCFFVPLCARVFIFPFVCLFTRWRAYLSVAVLVCWFLWFVCWFVVVRCVVLLWRVGCFAGSLVRLWGCLVRCACWFVGWLVGCFDGAFFGSSLGWLVRLFTCSLTGWCSVLCVVVARVVLSWRCSAL